MRSKFLILIHIMKNIRLLKVATIFFLFITLSKGLVWAESVFILQPNINEIKYKAIVDVNTIVTKPTCPSGWVASVFVTPAVFSAYSAATGWQLNVIAVVKSWAQDNGNGTWTIKLQLKDHQGNVFNAAGGHQRLLVETMCCPSGGSCQ
jgi:hypothetical protein